MAKDIRSLTGIRGIAALYVMFYHYFGYYTVLSTSTPISLFASRGYLSVDLFFILSGYLMCLTAGNLFSDKLAFSNLKLFMNKRFIRIYPIYFVILTVVFLTFNIGTTTTYIASIFLVNIFFYKETQILGTIWSLSAEWITYLLFPFLIHICYKVPRKILLVMLPGLALCIYAFIAYKLHKLGYFRILNIVSINGLSRCIAGYLIGIMLFHVNKKGVLAPYINMLQLMATFLIVALLFIPYTDILIVYLMGYLIYLLSYDKGIISRILSCKVFYFFGLISYSLYLIHIIFFLFPFSSNHDFNDLNVVMIRVAAMLITIGLSFLTYRLIEKPALNLLKQKLLVRHHNKSALLSELHS